MRERCCPLCGHAHKPLPSELEQLLDQAASLTGREMRVLVGIATVYPRFIRAADLAGHVWGDFEREIGDPSGTLYSYCSKMRSKLAPLGWAIVGKRGSGYRLEKLEARR